MMSLSIAQTRQDVLDVRRPEPQSLSPDPRLARLEWAIGRLKSVLRIAVIFGGDNKTPNGVMYPTIHTRAWKSYESVAHDIAQSLQRQGFQHVSLIPDDMNLPDRLRQARVHMAWLNTCGVQGHNPSSHTPALLEMIGVPYVGHDPLSVTLLDNKHVLKRELDAIGMPTARYVTWHGHRGPFDPETNSTFASTFRGHEGPFVVKPSVGRASLHVHVVDHAQDLPAAAAHVWEATTTTILIEAYLPGPEYVVAICGPVTAVTGSLRLHDAPFTFGMQQRMLEPGERIFTSMDVKPISKSRVLPLDPVRHRAERAELADLARVLFSRMNLSALVRLDVRADARGRLNVLEVNPKPDLKQPTETVTSLICEGLAEHGMGYDDLILTLFANRIDAMLSREHVAARHIWELLQ